MKGRFAPSPSGRMHLGNIFCALISWLSVRKQGGSWILRIEDLDPARSRREYAEMIEEDLRWLGLEPDEGGLSDIGPSGPYSQSRRTELYEDAFEKLKSGGLIYPCYCTRADLSAASAPHRSDNSKIYPGTCRPKNIENQPGKGCKTNIDSTDTVLKEDKSSVSRPLRAYRLMVADKDIVFEDRIYGRQKVNLAPEWGDFVIKRADATWAYQLAVTVDDYAMGVTEVVRGNDLLKSSAPQIYLYSLLGYEPPQFFHLPLLCNSNGQRLSKRDKALDMEQLRKDFNPLQLVGWLGYFAGILPQPFPISPNGLLQLFTPSLIKPVDKIEIN